jgi:hypothetical protein
MRNTPLKGMLNAASPVKQKAPKPKKEVVITEEKTVPKRRVNPTTGKHEMHTGTKTNPVTGEKTQTYSEY